MKFLFDNEAFSFETLRTTGFAAYGGADLGEVLSTVSHIAEGDEEGWHQAWKATAQRVAKIGEQAACVRAPRERQRRVLAGIELLPNRGGFPARSASDRPGNDIPICRTTRHLRRSGSPVRSPSRGGIS